MIKESVSSKIDCLIHPCPLTHPLCISIIVTINSSLPQYIHKFGKQWQNLTYSLHHKSEPVMSYLVIWTYCYATASLYWWQRMHIFWRPNFRKSSGETFIISNLRLLLIYFIHAPFVLVYIFNLCRTGFISTSIVWTKWLSTYNKL